MKRMTYLCRIGRTSLGLPRQAKADMSIKTAQLPALCLLNQYGIKKLPTVSDDKSTNCLVKSGKDNPQDIFHFPQDSFHYPQDNFSAHIDSFCYKLCNICSVLLNTYSKLWNKRYKLCNKLSLRRW